jgi:hypothetical protein
VTHQVLRYGGWHQFHFSALRNLHAKADGKGSTEDLWISAQAHCVVARILMLGAKISRHFHC